MILWVLSIYIAHKQQRLVANSLHLYLSITRKLRDPCHPGLSLAAQPKRSMGARSMGAHGDAFNLYSEHCRSRLLVPFRKRRVLHTLLINFWQTTVNQRSSDSRNDLAVPSPDHYYSKQILWFSPVLTRGSKKGRLTYQICSNTQATREKCW